MRKLAMLLPVLACAAVSTASASAASSELPKDPTRDRLAERLDVAAFDASEAATRIDAAAGSASYERRRGVTRRDDLTGRVPGLVITRDATLSTLRAAAPNDVREVAQGVWEIRRSLFVTRQATLTIDARQAHTVRLVSGTRGFTSIVAGAGGANEKRRVARPRERTGRLVFRGRRSRPLVVQSWDPVRREPDQNLRDGRASILARGGSRLYASDTHFKDLGFYEGRVSGVAVFSRRSTPGGGRVERCRFEGNWFGAYTYEARDMRWLENEFVGNYVYGFDPHDNSDGFVFEKNYAAGNARHGIIFSRLTDRNRIRYNLSERNGWHGIVIDDGKEGDEAIPLGPATSNEVSHNVVRDNGRVGIVVDGSHNNVVRNNRIIGGRYGIRVYGPAVDNRVERNAISGARAFGVFVDSPSSRTSLSGNQITDTTTGVRIRGTSQTSVLGNRMTSVDSHGVKIDPARDRNSQAVSVKGNRITGQGTSPIYVEAGERVDVEGNREAWDYPAVRDAARTLAWGVGPSLWMILALVVVGGGVLLTVLGRCVAMVRG